MLSSSDTLPAIKTLATSPNATEIELRLALLMMIEREKLLADQAGAAKIALPATPWGIRRHLGL
jgi:hypothetical protein